MAELVAEEVTRELLTSSEGTGILLSRPPQPRTALFPSTKDLNVTVIHSLYVVLSRFQIVKKKKKILYIHLIALYCFMVMVRTVLPLKNAPVL